MTVQPQVQPLVMAAILPQVSSALADVLFLDTQVQELEHSSPMSSLVVQPSPTRTQDRSPLTLRWRELSLEADNICSINHRLSVSHLLANGMVV
jgi:hypothetical protein